ncbi:MAG: hypothetical protein A2Y25_10765 [Candidatus Melainabacteria bacterium GWF2_37_15]|nr:MAG: hypothetical protein A2Y25_10765 [Candidatus Melainabacteria bacterium GWF2_37_15]
MSAPATAISNYFKNMASFGRITHSYFRRRNPVAKAVVNFLTSIYNLLSLKKRLKSMQYQVQLTQYRMHQMEKMMNEANPYNSQGGFHINKYR